MSPSEQKFKIEVYIIGMTDGYAIDHFSSKEMSEEEAKELYRKMEDLGNE
jgi:hypothetical protein